MNVSFFSIATRLPTLLVAVLFSISLVFAQSQFNGTYSGVWSGNQSSGSTGTGTLAFSVANGVVTGTTSPISGSASTFSGTVTASGAITASIPAGSGGCGGTLVGQVTTSSSGGTTTTGTYSLLASPTCNSASGTWSSTRANIGVFNGTYTGSWSSADQVMSDTGTLTFTVANGVITSGANPGSISSGTVSTSGAFTGSGIFNGHLPCDGGALTIAYTGQLSLTISGGAIASGDFTDPSSDPPNCVGSSGPWTATRTTATGVVASSEIPLAFTLLQSYPNPFNPSTTIEFSLPQSGYVTLRVYDIFGKEVVTLVADDLSAGRYASRWNAANVASGMYYYRLQAGSFIETRKLILLK